MQWREGFDFDFLCLSACVPLQFAFLRLAPRHADDTREGFDGGWSCHSAFFVSPPATLAVRGRFLTGGLPYYSVVYAFPSIKFLRVFPGFIARPFRDVGVGFEEPHLRFIL